MSDDIRGRHLLLLHHTMRYRRNQPKQPKPRRISSRAQRSILSPPLCLPRAPRTRRLMDWCGSRQIEKQLSLTTSWRRRPVPPTFRRHPPDSPSLSKHPPSTNQRSFLSEGPVARLCRGAGKIPRNSRRPQLEVRLSGRSSMMPSKSFLTTLQTRPRGLGKLQIRFNWVCQAFRTLTRSLASSTPGACKLPRFAGRTARRLPRCRGEKYAGTRPDAPKCAGFLLRWWLCSTNARFHGWVVSDIVVMVLWVKGKRDGPTSSSSRLNNITAQPPRLSSPARARRPLPSRAGPPSHWQGQARSHGHRHVQLTAQCAQTIEIRSEPIHSVRLGVGPGPGRQSALG